MLLLKAPVELELTVSYIRANIMKTKSIAIIYITIIILAALFWPTLYKYDKMIIGGNSFLLKINRFTGHTQYFSAGKWISQQDKISKKTVVIPIEDALKISGNGGFGSFGSFSGRIYNGSRWTLTDITIKIVAREKDNKIRWDRKFRTDIYIPPLSTRDLYISVTGESEAESEWSIEEVRGYKE
jgi:hypothetical protein